MLSVELNDIRRRGGSAIKHHVALFTIVTVVFFNETHELFLSEIAMVVKHEDSGRKAVTCRK